MKLENMLWEGNFLFDRLFFFEFGYVKCGGGGLICLRKEIKLKIDIKILLGLKCYLEIDLYWIKELK